MTVYVNRQMLCRRGPFDGAKELTPAMFRQLWAHMDALADSGRVTVDQIRKMTAIETMIAKDANKAAFYDGITQRIDGNGARVNEDSAE